MSRLSELILQLKRENPELGKEIEKEVRHLQDRRAFGLNFERHRPETVELYGRPVRKGDKVKMLPPRGETKAPDDRLWIVTGAKNVDGARIAALKDRRTDETAEYPLDDLVVVAESHDTIYPGLVSTGKIERGGDKPFHTVINGENLHALKMLLYTHRGKIDAIYIDPPYNTGARDWKYNNDYVEGDDIYRHSKWLAMMERRLVLARELLNPASAVLIVTIDEKEYLRLGMLLEQLFPESRIQMVSCQINPANVARRGAFGRNDEYIFFVMFGDSGPVRSRLGSDWVSARGRTFTGSVRWDLLRRSGTNARREDRPKLFYPILVDPTTRKIVDVRPDLPLGRNPEARLPENPNLVAVWPIRKDGSHGNWQLGQTALMRHVEQGRVRLGGSAEKGFVVYYLKGGEYEKIQRGDYPILGRKSDGSLDVGDSAVAGNLALPGTQWRVASHDSTQYGSRLLSSILPGRVFPFPKSLYAVEDSLRFFLSDKPNAFVLDFFAGSGTTAHAVMRLNRQDAGLRQCISITNNEVGADEQRGLLKRRLRPADPEWERLGICDYVTKPRLGSAISGRTPVGVPIKGDYKFTDEFPLADGFEQNAEFFTLTYEAPLSVATHSVFARIAPMLWLRAGATGRPIEHLEKGWDVADTYGVIADLDHLEDFLEAINAKDSVKIAYIVTDDDRQFAATCSALPERVEPVRLYESYLRNFQIDARRSSR